MLKQLQKSNYWLCNRHLNASHLKLSIMKLFIKPAILFLFAASLIIITSFTTIEKRSKAFSIKKDKGPKIQAAILLDVSNSMDGLIEQAKAQLWNMVSVMGKAKCEGGVPEIEIALYEYGRSTNDKSLGYVKQISPFSTDLDKLSQHLFKLTTNGGNEYCGQVIYTSLNELNWDSDPASYKVIFIAGNEDFLQGNLSFTTACAEAKKKGVIVNTIYCGDKMQGIREHWNLGGECGNGSYTNIDSNEKPMDIPTPYDTTLFVLNEKLNSTYIYYGAAGRESFARQEQMDKSNAAINTTTLANRTAVKGNSQLYDNSNWDLLDAARSDSTIISRVDMKTLPESLQNKSRAELKTIVAEKNKERSSIQQQIETINKERQAFIATEKAKAVNINPNRSTLEMEVEKIVRQQAKRFNMTID